VEREQRRERDRGISKIGERLEAAKDNVDKWQDREQKALDFIRPSAEARAGGAG
jgi:hypothetical protein